MALPVAAQRGTIDLPAGTLGEAVAALSARARISIAVADPALWRRRVPAVRGARSVEAALAQLLGGIGATVERAGPRVWRIVAKRRPEPSPRPVKAQAPPTVMPTEVGPDLIVTASKRDLTLRDYPGTVSVIDNAALSATAREGTEAIIEQGATLSSTYLGNGRNKLFLRGIADSSFTGPTQATVGQYWGDVRLAYNAPDPNLNLYDVAAVEVLEGPQGTLYGAGALGGIVRVVDHAPEPGVTRGTAEAGLSATWHGAPGWDGAGMVNLPLAQDGAALRLVGYGASEGGYIDDRRRGRRDVNRVTLSGGRASLRLEPAAGWHVDLGAIAQNREGRDSQYADRDAPPWSRESQLAEGFATRYLLGRLVIDGPVGALRLTSATGVVQQGLDERYDASIGVGPDQLFLQRATATMLVSETRLRSAGTPGGIAWVAGLSLLHNRTAIDRALGEPAAPAPVPGVLNGIDEAALFGEASIGRPSALRLTIGGRVARSWLTGRLEMAGRPVGAPASGRAETVFLPSASLGWRVAAPLLFFARYQEGFRPGGLAVEGDALRRFGHDRLATLEAGLRYGEPGRTRFDGTVSVTGTRWRDIQADSVDNIGLPGTSNIGNGRIGSLSATAGWAPMRGWRMEAGVLLNTSSLDNQADAIIFQFPFTASSYIPNVADVIARGTISYAASLPRGRTIAVLASARYIGRSRLGVGRLLGAEQGEYLDTRLAGRLGLGRIGLTLGVTNLADSAGNRFALGTLFDMRLENQITPQRPRAIRLGIDAEF